MGVNSTTRVHLERKGTSCRKRFLDSKDEHKDWKPLNLEIMRRFTLFVSCSASFAMEFDRTSLQILHDLHENSTSDLGSVKRHCFLFPANNYSIYSKFSPHAYFSWISGTERTWNCLSEYAPLLYTQRDQSFHQVEEKLSESSIQL